MRAVKNGGKMKKARLIPLLCAPVLLLSACSAGNIFGKAKPDFDTMYTVSADISYGGYSAKADITRRGEGDYIFSFNEPQQLMGITMTLSDGGFTAALGKLNVSTETGQGYMLIPDIIADSIDSLEAVPADSITEQDGILTLTTETDGNKVVVTSDSKGQLLTLKCPKHKLSVEFSGQSETTPAETVEETLEIIIE